MSATLYYYIEESLLTWGMKGVICCVTFNVCFFGCLMSVCFVLLTTCICSIVNAGSRSPVRTAMPGSWPVAHTRFRLPLLWLYPCVQFSLCIMCTTLTSPTEGDVLLFLINAYIHNSSHQADRETPHDGMERQSGSNLGLRAELSQPAGPLTLGLLFKKDFYCLWRKMWR